jgi:hypothetical protein
MKNSSLYLLVLFCIVIFASMPSQGQTPTPSKRSDEPKTQAPNSTKTAKTPQANAKNLSSPEILPIPQQTNKESPKVTEKQNDHSSPNWWLVYLTAALALVMIVQSIAMSLQAHWLKRQTEEIKQSLAIAEDTANAAKKSADVAEKTILATQRPWISVRPLFENGLKFALNEDILIKFKLKNVGNSPAVGTSFCAESFFSTPKRNNRDEQRRICDRFPNPPLSTGYILFPGEEITSVASIIISPEVIAQSNSEFHESYHESDPEYDASKYGEPDIWPVLAGCVKYAFAFDGSVHKTAFMLQFVPINPTADNVLSLYLHNDYVGNYAD